MKPHVIGITGRSGSGKTTLVKILLEQFGADHLSVLSLDDYYKARDAQKIDGEGYYNFDLPESFDLDKLYADLSFLLSGREVIIPSYQYNTSAKSEYKTIKPASIILVEGLFINYDPKINEYIDYNVFIKLDKETSYQRRLSRDINQRDYQQPEIQHRFFRHAEPAYNKYIQEYELLADCLLNSSINVSEDPSFHKLMAHIKQHIKK